jgi:hypothetical protein
MMFKTLQTIADVLRHARHDIDKAARNVDDAAPPLRLRR